MAIRRTITVSITPEQDAFVRDRLKTGRFSSVSEVVRAGLRLFERDEVVPEVKPSTRRKSVGPAAASGVSDERS